MVPSTIGGILVHRNKTIKRNRGSRVADSRSSCVHTPLAPHNCIFWKHSENFFEDVLALILNFNTGISNKGSVFQHFNQLYIWEKAVCKP